MHRRLRLRTLMHPPALPLSMALAFALAGCNYASPTPPALTPGAQGSGLADATAGAAAEPGAAPAGPERSEEKAAILDTVVRLIRSAAINPGGNHFGNATRNLNQYFQGTPASSYALDPQARDFLRLQLPAGQVDALESPTWSMPDARHLEDCMMYHGIATRVGGVGDDLTRARRVFDWMVRQVQLVPAGSLASPNLGQAFARPYDVLLRGMATESEGIWSERGWLFLSLCRQLGLDGGLITYTPRGMKQPVVWCCAILADGKPYLFDTRVGLPVPGPGGEGVATLDDALSDPAVLDRMDLPGQSPYGTTRAALRESPSKIGVLLDSGLRYFSPRMKLLQQSLAGKDLTVLYRDPAAQRDRFAAAIGGRFGKAGLWELPMTVETLLFTDPRFVESTQRSLSMFRSELPLLSARMKQLRGETAEAVEEYVALRFLTNATMKDGKTPIPPELQRALDVYATHFLGMCQLDRKNPGRAERFFEQTLKMLPAPGRGRPYFNMYRWGAQANLGRLLEDRGDLPRAAAYYSQDDPTAQRHGNLLAARGLVWRDPAGPLPPPLSPPPPSTEDGERAASAPPAGRARK